MKELDQQQIDQVTGALIIKCPIKKPPYTTLALGEEGGHVTSMMVGEEDKLTTLAIGEEGGGITPVASSGGALGAF